jgi:hypothetical protein
VARFTETWEEKAQHPKGLLPQRKASNSIASLPQQQYAVRKQNVCRFFFVGGIWTRYVSTGVLERGKPLLGEEALMNRNKKR